MSYYDLTPREQAEMEGSFMPHRMRLNCCSTCDAAIGTMWALALDSEYDEDGDPRVDTKWDREDEL